MTRGAGRSLPGLPDLLLAYGRGWSRQTEPLTRVCARMKRRLTEDRLNGTGRRGLL
jgi:hypothetical protein